MKCLIRRPTDFLSKQDLAIIDILPFCDYVEAHIIWMYELRQECLRRGFHTVDSLLANYRATSYCVDCHIPFQDLDLRTTGMQYSVEF